MTSESRDMREVARNLGIAGVGAVVAAVLVNQFLAPPLASWFFARTPVAELVQFDQTRSRATRHLTVSFIAGLMGPPHPGARKASGSSSESIEGGSRRAQASGGGEGEDAGSPTSDREPSGTGSDDPATSERAAGRAREKNSAPGPGDDSNPEAGGRTAESDIEQKPTVPEETPVYELDRRAINQRLDNPEGIRRRITLIPTDGKAPGLRVVELQGYYAQFGLHPGDVVVSLDGNRLATRQQAIRYLLRSRRKTSFRVKVRRRGEAFRIRYEVPFPK